MFPLSSQIVTAPASEYILHHLHISFVNITGTLSKTINDLILELPLTLAGKSRRSLNRRDDILSVSAIRDAIFGIISQSANG